jgi:phosphoribosylformylglycinamidine cyclo-ligase
MAHDGKPAPDQGRYAGRGVSASKGEVHAVVDGLDRGLFPGAFCKLTEDILTGDPARCNVTHSDGSGTKALLAYLWWRETGDASAFRGIAQDSVVMNIDDLLCVGAVDRILLSSTLNRNARRIPGEILRELIEGTEECLQRLRDLGLGVRSGGGETADVGDLTPTLTVDSTATAVLRREQVIDAKRIRPGLAIVGVSSSGTCGWEPDENSGVGSNGLTSARHELLSRHYAEQYPETYDNATAAELVYCGPHRLADPLPGSSLVIGRALLSPTRSYTPVVVGLLRELGVGRLPGLIHCSGGGQTKCLRFGEGVRHVKDNLFPVPPIFAEIARCSGTSPREMHQVYNMGHRLEIYVEPRDVAVVTQVCDSLMVKSQVVGHTEASSDPMRNQVELRVSGEVICYPQEG